MKGLNILLIALTLIIFISNSAHAHEFNITDGKGFLLFPKTAFSEPLDPKIACNPDGSSCLMLVYQNNSFFGRGVNVWFTTNYFNIGLGTRQVTNIVSDFTSFYYGFFDNYHLPYDVSYVSSQGKYYFFVKNAIYSYDGISITSLGNIATSPSRTAGRRWGLGFINETHIRTFESIVALDNDNKVFSKLKGTVLGTSFIVNATWSDSVGNPTLRYSVNLYDGSYPVGITTVSGCGAGTSCSGSLGLGSFPTSYTGLDHYTNEQITYQRFGNSSWKVQTTDFSSYGTASLIYSWNTSGKKETINNSDSAILNKRQLYSYLRDSNNTNINGIWIYNIPLTEVRFLLEGFDPIKKTTELVNVTVNLNCSSETWEDSDTGQNARINTPCNSGNELRIESFTFKPNVFSFSNYTIPNNCIGLSNIIRTAETKAYYKPYDFTITYFDSIFGNRIQGVTSILNSDLNTSNVKGQVLFNTFPIENPNFTVSQDTGACTTFLTFTGTPKSYSHVATKTGYEPFSETFTIATSPFDIETDFKTTRNIFLTPLNTIIEVHLFSKDGIELFPTSNIDVKLYGSNITYWSLNNELFETNEASIVPAKFILLNNTGTFNINITLNYFGEYNETLDVTTSEFKQVDIFINKSSWELPCNNLDDCTPNLCNGQFYKILTSCTNNLCTYQTQDCLTSSKCDQNIGCVDLVSTTNCTTDGDCDNTCIDSTRMLNNKCGFDNFCKGTFVTCQQDCNATLGYCQELAQCLNKNEKTYKGGFVRPEDSKFIGGTVHAFCDFSNVNKYTCGFQDGLIVQKSDLDTYGLTFNDVVVDPKGWQAEFVNNGNDLKLYALSIYCNEYCNMSYEFCKNGCDIETGRCKGTQQVIDDSFGATTITHDLFTGIVLFYNAIFPDIHSRSFMWVVWAIILYLIIWTIKVRVLPSNLRSIQLGDHHMGEIIIMLIWFLVGSVFGQFYWFIWFAVVVIAVYLFANYWTNKNGGGN